MVHSLIKGTMISPRSYIIRLLTLKLELVLIVLLMRMILIRLKNVQLQLNLILINMILHCLELIVLLIEQQQVVII